MFGRDKKKNTNMGHLTGLESKHQRESDDAGCQRTVITLRSVELGQERAGVNRGRRGVSRFERK